MSLEKYLQDLAQGVAPPKYAGLLRLSGLTSEEMELFRRQWASCGTQARQDVLGKLVEMTDNNVEVDFTFVFSHCLNDPDGLVRERAVLGLWESDDRSLIQPLVKLMEEDPVEQVRAIAAQALGKFAALGEEGKLLARDRERVREALLRVVQNKRETIEVRRRALETVALFDTTQVRSLIWWAYKHDIPGMRESAVHAMGRNGDVRWMETILQELQSADPAMRYEAIHACGEMANEEATPYLVSLTKDEEPQVQVAAIQALGVIGGRLARRVLLDCAKSDDEVVRDAAQDAIRCLEVGEEPLGFRFHL